jgi:hypothetical protein
VVLVMLSFFSRKVPPLFRLTSIAICLMHGKGVGERKHENCSLALR